MPTKEDLVRELTQTQRTLKGARETEDFLNLELKGHSSTIKDKDLKINKLKEARGARFWGTAFALGSVAETAILATWGVHSGTAYILGAMATGTVLGAVGGLNSNLNNDPKTVPTYGRPNIPTRGNHELNTLRGAISGALLSTVVGFTGYFALDKAYDKSQIQTIQPYATEEDRGIIIQRKGGTETEPYSIQKDGSYVPFSQLQTEDLELLTGDQTTDLELLTGDQTTNLESREAYWEERLKHIYKTQSSPETEED